MSLAPGARVQELFHEALALAPSRRSEWLERLAASDREVAREIEGLVASALEAPRFLEDARVRVRSCEHVRGGAWAGARAGPFQIESLLAEGGMGQVFVAVQDRPRRRVALKVVHPLAASPQTLARFEREVEILAGLDHPRIAKVFEAGTAELAGSVRPYLAMELVDGSPITRFARERALSARARIELFLQLCDAVQHAHQKGVIHRDLKPANVLVDRAGAVKVLDFGIARVLRANERVGETLTIDGQLLGTPAYMSPEHFAGRSGAIDVQSDVYSLGVMLFELLAGRAPLELDGLPLAEVARRVAEDSPPQLGALDRALRGDLEAIVAKALEKEPRRRYASARELAADLDNYRRRQPVNARRASASRRAVSWMRRHPTAASVLALGLASLSGLALLLHEVSARSRVASDRQQQLRLLERIAEVDGLAARADELWPLRPELADALELWIADARAVASELAQHELRLRASSSDQPAPQELLRRIAEARTSLSDPERGLLDGVSPARGWGVARRLAILRDVEQRSVASERARERWSVALRSIADERECPAYRGLRLAPQFGLLPLARNATTALWEFVHLQSGAEPRGGGAEGSASPEDGIVLVLLSGGRFTMGSQTDDPSAPHYCASAQPNETPPIVHELAPFFASKYELTQAQWARCTGVNPSAYHGAQHTPRAGEDHRLHPVERVSWFDCQRLMHRLDLCLPTEIQWEYAARAGTSTPWWTGAERDSLIGAVNVADHAARATGFDWPDIAAWPELDDGYAEHAPVDSTRANPFGLVHVHGNILEWCLDPWTERLGYSSAADEHGARPTEASDGPMRRIVRGGCFDRSADRSRSAYRSNADADMAYAAIGLRPTRRLDD